MTGGAGGGGAGGLGGVGGGVGGAGGNIPAAGKGGSITVTAGTTISGNEFSVNGGSQVGNALGGGGSGGASVTGTAGAGGKGGLGGVGGSGGKLTITANTGVNLDFNAGSTGTATGGTGSDGGAGGAGGLNSLITVVTSAANGGNGAIGGAGGASGNGGVVALKVAKTGVVTDANAFDASGGADPQRWRGGAAVVLRQMRR